MTGFLVVFLAVVLLCAHFGASPDVTIMMVALVGLGFIVFNRPLSGRR